MIGPLYPSHNFFLWLYRTFPPIFKDLITLRKCLKLVTDKPNEMRKLKEELANSSDNHILLPFCDFLSIFGNFLPF